MSLQDKLDKQLSTIFGDPSQHFYDIYTERLELIDAELEKRNSDIGKLYRLYEYNYQTNFADGELIRLRTEVNNSLNLQKYLEGDEGEENYWLTFCSYIREDTYTNENYISAGLDNTELIERAKELLEVAEMEAVKSANNKYTITAPMVNLLAIPEFQKMAPYFEVGNWIRVEFEDTVYKLRLMSYQLAYDNPESLDVEFSTAIFSSTSSSEIRDILESARKISGSYNAVVKQVQKTTETANDTADKVDGGIDSTNTPVINNQLTQDFIIDKNGILGRAYDDIEDKYDDCQIRIVNNCLYMTNDGWKTIHTALGKFSYDDDGEEKTAYGINTETLVGNIVLSKYLSVQNDNGTLTFNEDGLKVENMNKTACIEINPNAENVFQISTGYDVDTGEYTKNVMYVDGNGNGYFDGEIESESGTIGGWTINTDNISKSTDYYLQEGDTYRDGTSSLILSSNGSSEYALKAIYNFQEWFTHNAEKTNKENSIEISNDGYLYVRSKAQSTEGGSSLNTIGISGEEIVLHGTSGSGGETYEILINGQGIDFNSSLVYIDASIGVIGCKELTVNGSAVSLEGHSHTDLLQLIEELQQQVDQIKSSI